jgi:hypothetical protein
MKTTMAVVLLFLAPLVLPQQGSSDRQSQDAHHQGVNQRGDQAMGLSQGKATHHFYLYADGGAIEVNANDPLDTTTRDQMRMHFTHIAKMFSDGNFSIPMLIHQQNPPGADVMMRLRSQITYKFDETPQGGRIRITSANKEALAAIHKFLVFQIQDHQTGDTMAITKPNLW